MSALVGVIMGSQSDWPTMKNAVDMLEEFGVPYEVKVVSAHRTPDLMFEYAETAQERGLEVILLVQGVLLTCQEWLQQKLLCQFLEFQLSQKL